MIASLRLTTADGDLISLVERKGPLSDVEARHVFRRIIRTAAVLHENGICHRDLKPDNFLINFCCSSPNAIVVDIKLTDFELAAELDDEKEMCIPCGSPTYAGFSSLIPPLSFTLQSLSAPEMCKKEHYDGRKVDVWSAGVLLYTILCGEFPWSHPDVFVRSHQYRREVLTTTATLQSNCV